MFRAIGRFLVATAAGAGLGAGAALYRRHLIELEPGDAQWAPAADSPADFERTTPPQRPSQTSETAAVHDDSPDVVAAPAAPHKPTAEDLAALRASVADLEAARARLRERAAALRAEMEGEGR